MAAALVILLTALVGTNGQWFTTGWAAGTSITAQRFYVESLSATPGVALQDLFSGSAPTINGRLVPTIDPDGGTTFGTFAGIRPGWSTSDTAWRISSSRALHGATGAPSVVSIPWLSRSSYVQVRLAAVGSSSNAGLGILCDGATNCVGVRVSRSGGIYFLSLGTLAGSTFSPATAPTCSSGPSCSVAIGTSVPSSTDLRITYDSTTAVARMTFGAYSASMTVPSAYRGNTRAGLFAVTNSDGTRFTSFQAGSQ